MRKTAFVALMLLFGLAIAACAQPAAESPAPVGMDLGGRVVSVMVENAYPPFNFIDEATGEGAGWDYDVWRELCQRLNCEPVFVESAWPPFEKMAAGELDVAADGITLLLERALIVDFSDPYVDIGQVLLVRADEQEIVDEASLVANQEALVGSQIGTTNYEVAVGLVGDGRVRPFDTFDTPVLALIAGDVDAVIIDVVAAVGFMSENPGELKITGEPLTSGELLAFVFPPGSELIGPVNLAMQQMFADGKMDEYCQKWFFQDCTPTADE